MVRRNWKRVSPSSLQQAMELCVEHARDKHNRSVDRIAVLMGLSSKWSLYKWIESGRMPAILIRPFESACGIDFVTHYMSLSAHKLLIDMPSGRKATAKDVNAIQVDIADSVSLLIRFYEGETDAHDTLAALNRALEGLAWHRSEVMNHKQPDLDFFDAQSSNDQ